MEHKETSTLASNPEGATPGVPAGDFSSWLRQTRAALDDESEAQVACGDCVGCCSSSYFIHIEPEEAATLAHIPREFVVAAPGRGKGHVLMGHREDGRCPMLTGGKCSIYQHRPQTCRRYDCRVFAAAGIDAGGAEKATINQRVRSWIFSYPTQRDSNEHEAVCAAATFMREHADSFPGGRVPGNPSELAVLAIKVYEVFLGERGSSQQPASESENAAIAAAIVAASRRFDAKAPAAGDTLMCETEI